MSCYSDTTVAFYTPETGLVRPKDRDQQHDELEFCEDYDMDHMLTNPLTPDLRPIEHRAGFPEQSALQGPPIVTLAGPSNAVAERYRYFLSRALSKFQPLSAYQARNPFNNQVDGNGGPA